jgi:hypothetical protein
MICHDRKFIFIHMCRCAGSSIEVYFGKDLDELNLSGERHATPRRYKAYWQEYFTFTIARNPWDRAYSAFQYTLQRNLTDTPLKQRLHNESAGDFKTFIRSVLSDTRQFDESDDRLFWPQCRWLMEGGRSVEFDRILRFETLDRDLNSVAERLGLSSFNLPRTNESARHDYRAAYDTITADIVGRIYADDVSLLDYRFD